MLNAQVLTNAVIVDVEKAMEEAVELLLDEAEKWLQDACDNRLFKYFRNKPEYKIERQKGVLTFTIESKIFFIQNFGAVIPERRARQGKAMPIPKVKQKGTLVRGSLDSQPPDRRKLTKDEIFFVKKAKGFTLDGGRWDLILKRELEQAIPQLSVKLNSTDLLTRVNA